MSSPLLLELHAHGRKAVDITPWTKRVQWGESINAPWDSMAVELALPLGEMATKISRTTGQALRDDEADVVTVKTSSLKVNANPGLWLKLTEYATGRMLSMARIDTRPLNLRAGAKGSISNRVSLQALGAWSFIRTLAVEFVVGTINEDYGGIMAAGGPAAKRYYALFQRLIRGPLASEIVGASGIIATLAPVQIPETLVPGVSTLGELFRIAWGPGELGKAAPLRTMTRVPLADTAALAYVLPQGTALDMITAIYQREPRLIELFPSMEAPTNDPMKPGYADARPTIIHRIAPLITGPLSKMVVETGDAPNVSIPTTYDKPTWSLANGLTLKANEGFAMSPTRSEAARVNVVTVNWSVAGGSEARWLTPAGLPIADRADIDQHGARLLELNWDLGAGDRRKPSGSRTFDDLNARLGATATGNIQTLRTVGLLGWHFYGLGHVFEAGTIEGDYLGLRARAGEPLSFDYGGKRPFTAYMTGVTHTAEVKNRGVFSARTSIQFDRGLWDERLRDPHVYRETKAAPKVTQRPVEQKAEEPVQDAAFTGLEAAAWTGATAVSNPSLAISRARAANIDRLCVFVNDRSYVNGPWRTYNEDKIVACCEAIRAAGLKCSLVSWMTPDPAWSEIGARKFGELGTRAGVDEIELDLEEPWTVLKAKPTATILAVANAVFANIRSAFSGAVVVDCIVGTDLRALGPMITLSDGVIPQAYRTEANAAFADLETRSVAKFGVYGKPIIMGIAAYKSLEPLVLADPATMRTALTKTRELGLQRTRFWRLEMFTPQNGAVVAEWKSGSMLA